MTLITETEAKKALVVPLQLIRKKLVVGAFDPNLGDAHEIFEKLKKSYELQIFIVSLTSLKYAWKHYQYVVPQKEITGKIEINEENLKNLTQAIKTLSDLNQTIKNFKSPHTSQVLEIFLAGAISLEASDIHLEPKETSTDLRLRIDGLLHTAYDELSLFIYQSFNSLCSWSRLFCLCCSL